MSTNVRVGAVQAEPVWFDIEGSVNKTVSLIESAAADGVQVVCIMPSNFSVAIREPKNILLLLGTYIDMTTAWISRGMDPRVSMVSHME